MLLKLLSYNVQRGGGGREAQLAAVINACNPDYVDVVEFRNLDNKAVGVVSEK